MASRLQNTAAPEDDNRPVAPSVLELTRRHTFATTVAGMCWLLVALGFVLLVSTVENRDSVWALHFWPLVWTTAASCTFALAFGIRAGGIKTGIRIVKEKATIDRALGVDADNDYFGKLVRINIMNLSAYYELIKLQASRSFIVSLVIATLGALLIMTGLVRGIDAPDQVKSLSFIAAGAGIVAEFIAAMFFWLYSRTVVQLRGSHQSLLRVQNVLLVFKLISDTPSAEQRASLIADLCRHLLVGGGDVLSPAADRIETMTPAELQLGLKRSTG